MPPEPKVPDPWETAQAQGSMNRDTAITQQQLNMINQVTPYGTLEYTQTGQSFAPSDTGSIFYYNPATGEYRSDRPQVGTQMVASGGVGEPQAYGGNRDWLRPPAESGGMTEQPIYDDAWQEVKGILTPSYTATTTLSPEQQAIYDQSSAAMGNIAGIAEERSRFLGDYLRKGVDTSGVPDLIGNPGLNERLGLRTNLGLNDRLDLATSYAGADDFSADRQRVEDALWERQAGDRMQAQDRLRTQLINAGLRPGTAAWDSEMARLSRAEGDQRLGTILAAGDEQARMVGMARDAAIFGNDARTTMGNFTNQARAANAAFEREGQMANFNAMNNARLQNATFQNAARGQGLQEAYAARAQPINELGALLGLGQVQTPQFQATPQTGVGGVDYTGLVNNKYNAEMQSYQAGMGGLFGLGSALIGALPFSDERLKTDIRRVGYTDGGTPIFTYRYKGDDTVYMGVMAQHVPDARVVDPETGFYRVDYRKVN